MSKGAMSKGPTSKGPTKRGPVQNGKRVTSAHQSITFSRRMLLTGGAQVAVGAVLIGRLGWLSVAENEHYQLLSESNRVQLIIVPPLVLSICVFPLSAWLVSRVDRWRLGR